MIKSTYIGVVKCIFESCLPGNLVQTSLDATVSVDSLFLSVTFAMEGDHEYSLYHFGIELTTTTTTTELKQLLRFRCPRKQCAMEFNA